MVNIFVPELSIKFVCKWTACCPVCNTFDKEMVLCIPVKVIDVDIPVVTVDLRIFCHCNVNRLLICFFLIVQNSSNSQSFINFWHVSFLK